MEDWENDAWHAVRNTLARYTWSGDFADVEGFVDCFAEDAVLQIKGGARYEGHAGLRRLGAGQGPESAAEAEATPRDATPLRHHVSSIRIEIESRVAARAWSYFVTFGPHGVDHWGRYADELVPDGEAGRWLLRRRRVSIDGASPDSRRFPEGIPT